MLVVHGVLRGEDARELDTSALTEVSGSPVRLVEHRDLAALTTETDAGELLPSRANLLAHTGILGAVAPATVLPMRFGVAVPDGATLRDAYLEPVYDAMLERLDRLDGHVELRLRGTYDEDAVLQEILETDRRARRLRGRESFEARIELGERVAAGIGARRDRDAALVLDELRQHAADVAPGRLAEPLDAFTLSFLVGRGSLDAFDEAVDRLAEKLGTTVHLELVGPLPPFSFAADDDGAAGGG